MSKVIIPVVVLGAALALPTPTLAQGGWTLCADEGLWCEWHGAKQIRYGASGRYVVVPMRGTGFMCENKRFGRDPAPGAKKFCWIKQ